MPRVRDLTPELVAFWRERHLCSVTSIRPDGSLHVVPMGVVLDPETRSAWAITSRTSHKVAHLLANPTVAVCQVDGRRWCTLEGRAEVLDDEASVSEAVQRYAERYRQPRGNPSRVALRIALDRVTANV
jgi:PPOX class probable F420-dependent enzyme